MRPASTPIPVALAVACAAALFACGGAAKPTAYQVKVAEAARAHTSGRHEDAARAYDAAALAEAKPRDRDYVVYLAALAYLRSGDARTGLARLDTLAKGTGEYAPQAAFRAVETRAKTAEGAATQAAYLDIARRYPANGVGKVSLLRVFKEAREAGGHEAVLVKTTELEATFGNTELAETVVYERAKALRELGKAAEAEHAFLDVAARFPYPRGAYFDDSLMAASELAEARGDVRTAIEDLDRLLLERETSHTMGTYQRPKMSPALLRVGELYESKVGDREAAIRAYERLYREFTTSLLRDDALFRAARLHRALGRNDVACQRLSTLTSDFPDSRFVPCAEATCGLVRGAKSHAPKTCRE